MSNLQQAVARASILRKTQHHRTTTGGVRFKADEPETHLLTIQITHSGRALNASSLKKLEEKIETLCQKLILEEDFLDEIVADKMKREEKKNKKGFGKCFQRNKDDDVEDGGAFDNEDWDDDDYDDEYDSDESYAKQSDHEDEQDDYLDDEDYANYDPDADRKNSTARGSMFHSFVGRSSMARASMNRGSMRRTSLLERFRERKSIVGQALKGRESASQSYDRKVSQCEELGKQLDKSMRRQTLVIDELFE